LPQIVRKLCIVILLVYIYAYNNVKLCRKSRSKTTCQVKLIPSGVAGRKRELVKVSLMVVRQCL